MDPPQPVSDGTPKDPPKSAEEWLPLIYKELRALASAKMARERENHTLQPTALVLEAWLRMKDAHQRGCIPELLLNVRS
ncbi:MAG: hypothetical protein EXS36_06690 [Pedosphaera sp.]|nr:hypothetical protein [Pedosphaera sp.]